MPLELVLQAFKWPLGTSGMVNLVSFANST
jgi:hypothetical protein